MENKDKQPEIILKELRRSYQIAFSTKEGKEVALEYVKAISDFRN